MTSDKPTSKSKISLKDAVEIAKKGTHCGMCKIDFLENGVCPAGKKHGFLAYWPQGRMEIVKNLYEGKVTPTEKLIDIVNSCSLCGICDKQCNFITQLRPEKVAKALKEYVDNLDKSEFKSVPEDDILRGLRTIVGEEWASNDPIIISSYIRSIINPDSERNFYIVMPETTEQVAKIIKFANKNNLPFMPRAGGTWLSMCSPTVISEAFSLEQGIVIDLLRMRKLEIHPESCTATVGAGITAFELQKEAYKHNLRALVAEAGAHVCANIVSSGILSTWFNRYGWAADNFIDLSLVNDEGEIKKHSDIDINNPYSTDPSWININLSPPGILTESVVKLHPVYKNEEAVLVPFENFKDALDMLMKLGKHGIGISLAVLSHKYLAEFICPTPQIAKDFEYICTNYLKLNYIVTVICDEYEKKIVEEMAEYIIDKSLIKSFILGSPKLASLKDSEFMKVLSEEEDPLKAIITGPMRKHLEKGLDASPEQIAKVFDEDLQVFFKKVYSKPEMTDIVWLHAFRILPSRMMRQRMFLGQAGKIWPSNNGENVIKWHDMIIEECNKYNNFEHALGFMNIGDNGKIVGFEYDFYYDHNDPEAAKNVSKASLDTTYKSLQMGRIIILFSLIFKGIYRKEHTLYPIPKPISEEDLLIFKELLSNLLEEEL